MKVALALVLLASCALAQDDCTVDHCMHEYQAVIDTEGGMDVLTCLANCIHPNCPYLCGVFDTDIPTHELFQCRADNHCYPDPPPTIGTYIGTDDDAVKDLAEQSFFSGYWYNVKGMLSSVLSL